MLDLTPLLRVYAYGRARRLRRQDPAAVQTRQLLSLVDRAKATRFGRDHDFRSIRSVTDFQQRVPLFSYEQMWERYWQPSFPTLTDVSWPGTVPFFALSSGTTTGETKYIPCTREMTVSNQWAGADILVHHLRNRPSSRIMAGRSFMLGGSTALTQLAPGIFGGDLSGIAGKVMPAWSRPRYFPPRALETIADWEEKIAAFAPESLEADIRAISGTPSWLLVFFEKLRALTGRERLVDWYPDLELVIHGGVNFEPYRHRFGELMAGGNVSTREVYPASEGFVAVADRGDGEGMRLILDTGLFYEFVPVSELDSPEPTRHWVATVEPGVDYALIVSSCAGLWSYAIGDVVQVVDRRPPRVLIAGRTSQMLSAFGEHVIAAEIEHAVAVAAAEIDRDVSDFAVGPVFPSSPGVRGHHLYLVEFQGDPPDTAALELFTNQVDQTLSVRNADYRIERAGNLNMGPPMVTIVKTGGFAAWMKRRGKLGGQHKVPRIVTDPELFTDLRGFVETGAGPNGR